MDWTLVEDGLPEKRGYYLGAWWHVSPLSGERWAVSELWYNPRTIGTGWWTARGYLEERLGVSRPVIVVAWMPVPVFEPEPAREDEQMALWMDQPPRDGSESTMALPAGS